MDLSRIARLLGAVRDRGSRPKSDAFERELEGEEPEPGKTGRPKRSADGPEERPATFDGKGLKVDVLA